MTYLLFQVVHDGVGAVRGHAWVSSVDDGHRVAATLASELAWRTSSRLVVEAKRIVLERAMPQCFSVRMVEAHPECSRCGSRWPELDEDGGVALGLPCPLGNPVGDADDPNVSCGYLGGRILWSGAADANPTLPRSLRRAYLAQDLEPSTCRLPGEDDWIRATALAGAICARAGDDTRALEILDASGVTVATLALLEEQGGVADYDTEALLPLMPGPLCEEGVDPSAPEPTWSRGEPLEPGMKPWAEVTIRQGVRGWALYWRKAEELFDDSPAPEHYIRWPFGDQAVPRSDLAALGFLNPDDFVNPMLGG